MVAAGHIVQVAEQGHQAPLEHGVGSCCRRIYALAWMFPPKLLAHVPGGGGGARGHIYIPTVR